jgi:hypothetical protein
MAAGKLLDKLICQGRPCRCCLIILMVDIDEKVRILRAQVEPDAIDARMLLAQRHGLFVRQPELRLVRIDGATGLRV